MSVYLAVEYLNGATLNLGVHETREGAARQLAAMGFVEAEDGSWRKTWVRSDGSECLMLRGGIEPWEVGE